MKTNLYANIPLQLCLAYLVFLFIIIFLFLYFVREWLELSPWKRIPSKQIPVSEFFSRTSSRYSSLSFFFLGFHLSRIVVISGVKSLSFLADGK